MVMPLTLVTVVSLTGSMVHPALFDFADPPLNFCRHVVNHATLQNYINSLARPEAPTQRGFKW
jgi:hypothetical protein